MGHYMYCRALYSNWKNNVFEEITASGKECCFELRYLDDEVAIIFEKFKNLIVFDSNTGEVQERYAIDETLLSILEKYDDLLVAGGCLSARVWNMKTKKCVFHHTYKSFEQGLIKSITIFKNFLVLIVKLTESCKSSLCVTDMKTSKIMYRRGRVDFSTACFDNDMLALAKLNGEIEIFDLNFSLMHVLKAESDVKPLQIVIKGDYLIYFVYEAEKSFFTFALIWNAKTGKLLRKIAPLDYKSCIFLHEDKLLYYTGEDGKEFFKLCNFITGEVLITISKVQDIR